MPKGMSLDHPFAGLSSSSGIHCLLFDLEQVTEILLRLRFVISNLEIIVELLKRSSETIILVTT